MDGTTTHISPELQQAFQYCEWFAQQEGFEIDLRLNYRNAELLYSVMQLATPGNLEVLKPYCELLAHASRCGEMQGVLHRPPSERDAEAMMYLFDTLTVPIPTDVKFTKLEAIDVEIFYNVIGIHDTDGVPEATNDEGGQMEKEAGRTEVQGVL